jgi:hypothetical protein
MLFLAPATLHSGVYGEPVEVVLSVWSSCVRVIRRRLANYVGGECVGFIFCGWRSSFGL